MRKLFAILLSVALCLCAALWFFAGRQTASEEPVSVTYANEYEYAQFLQSATDEELAALNLTREEADEYVSLFQDALDARAALSEEELLDLGYTAQEVSLLKAYDAGAELESTELSSITATCTGFLTCTSADTKSASFCYNWCWDRCPLTRLQDAAAVVWYAYSPTGRAINVTEHCTTSLAYYDAASDTYHHQATGTPQPGVVSGAINLQFEMREDDGLFSSCYAKRGSISVEVSLDGVDNSICYLLVAAQYGHTESGTSTPILDFSRSISLTGDSDITHYANDKIKIRSDGSYEHID